MSASFHPGSAFLVVEVIGEATLVELCNLADKTVEVAAAGKHQRVLFNFTQLVMKLAFTEHLNLGMHVAHVFHGLERIATVVLPVYKTGISEKVAQRGGLRLRAFSDLESAIEWIAEDGP